jgi:PAS domain S-box-containing protein
MEHDKLRQGETKTTEQLLKELVSLRRRIAKLEQTQSEHKKPGDKGRSLEKQLKDILDNTPVGIYRTTPDGRILIANPALVRMLGYSSFEELAGRNLEKEGFEPQYPRSMFKERIEKDGQVIGLESAWIRQDGITLFIVETAWAVRDKHARTLYYEGIVQDITELKESKEALEKSEQKFRSLFDNASDGMVLADIESKKFIIANKMFSQMLGCNLEETKNLSVADIHPKNAVPYVIEQFERQSRKEISLARDIPVKRKDGSVFYADINAFPITLAGKEYLAGIFRDITERKQTEDKLRQYQIIVESAHNPIFLKDLKSRYIIANKSTLEALGLSREQVIGKNDCEITPDKERARKNIEDDKFVLKTGKPKEVTKCMRGADGKERWFHRIKIPYFDNKGKVIGLIGIARDITRRKHIEEALEKSESKYRTLLENLPQRIFLKDRDSVYMSCNENYAKDLRIKPEEIAGKTDYDFYPKELAEKYRSDDKKIIESGQIKDIEEKYLQDGQERTVHTVKAPVTDEQGEVIGVLGIFWDITEQKKAEEELGTYREKMTCAEQLVSVGAISASLVHELTQPLTVAHLSIESVLAKPETRHIPGAVEKKLRNCLSGVSDACSIIKRFRDYARGMSRTVVTKMNFKVIAERIVKLLEGNAIHAKVNVLVKGLNRLPPVHLSERDIEFLFFALIDNAIQAADGKKEHHLTISGAKKGRQIELQFSDDCGGIAPENLDKIFELFFTTKPIGKGTGLGLCIVKQIASRVGGEVRVESEMGKGSTFFVTLPIKIGGKL